MKTRFAFGIALAVVVLAGCQKQPATSTPSSPAASSARTEQAAAGKLTQAKAFKQALPEGVVLDFPYHARSVKNVQSKKTGKTSQQFLFEYLGTNAKAAADLVSADMTRAGFTMSAKKKKKNGYNLAFTKGGEETTKVYVRKTSQKKLRHAEAKGLIRISFPAPTTAAPQPAA